MIIWAWRPGNKWVVSVYTRCLPFWVWLTLYSMMVYASIFFSGNNIISFCFILHSFSVSLSVCTTFSFSFVYHQAVWFHNWAVVNTAAVNVIRKYLCGTWFRSLFSTELSGAAGSYDTSSFKFLRNCIIDWKHFYSSPNFVAFLFVYAWMSACT